MLLLLNKPICAHAEEGSLLCVLVYVLGVVQLLVVRCDVLQRLRWLAKGACWRVMLCWSIKQAGLLEWWSLQEERRACMLSSMTCQTSA